MNTIPNCIICHKQLQGRQSMFCSISCKNKSHQSYIAQRKRGISRKLKLIEENGGKCKICGYEKNLAALSFHHEKEEKKFKLDIRSLSNRTYEKVLIEANKCTLICQNCHAELHNEHLDLAKLLKSSRTLYH